MPLIRISMEPELQDWQKNELVRLITRTVERTPGLDEYQLIISFTRDDLYYRSPHMSMALFETVLFENESRESQDLSQFSQNLTRQVQELFQIAPERILILFSVIEKWSMAGHLIDLEGSGSSFFF